MSQNPYQSPADSPPASSLQRFPRHAFVSIIGSIFLVLLGIGTMGLSWLPSDAPDFFLVAGAHLTACGTLGLICAWAGGRAVLGPLIGGTSLIANAALIVRLAMLISGGTMSGSLAFAGPLLLGVPAATNILSALLYLRRSKKPVNMNQHEVSN